MLKVLILCVVVSMALAADSTVTAEDNTPAASQSESHDVAATEKPSSALSGFPSELSFLPGGILGHVITGGTVAVAVIAIVLIASLFYPFSSVKGLCDLTGSCPTSSYRVDTYPSPGILTTNTQYSDTYNSPYSQPGAYSSPTYQKRSVEYVGPILKMLNAAYDKYTGKSYQSNTVETYSTKLQDKKRRR